MVDAVTYILDNDTTVKGLVGLRSSGGSDYKVFPVVVPESETAPYIVVRQSGQVSKGKGCGFDYTIDVICYADSYDAVKALAVACRTAVTGTATGSVNGFAYGFMNFTNESDGDFIKGHDLYTRILTFDGYGG